MVPVALTNSAASASEAVEGAPISGPGMAETTLVQNDGRASAGAESLPADTAEPAEQVVSHLV